MKNSDTRKVIGEGTIQFRSLDGCITILQGVSYAPELRYTLISLEALQGKGSVLVVKVILWKFSKRPM